MLEGLRRAQQNWLGKIIISVLFAILIASFAMVFVQPYLTGQQANVAVTAGKTTVSLNAFKSEYEKTRRQIEIQTNQPLSQSDAKAMQLDRTVLSRVVQQAVLDESARKLGLSISDDAVLQSIYAIPQFKTPLGLNRSALNSYLSTMGMSEEAFIAEQRAQLVRSQLLAPLIIGISAPKALQDFAARLIGERRDISFYTLTDAAIGDIPAPTDAQIEATYQAHKAQFRAPEYRSFEAIAVEPEAFANPGAISDEEASKAFSGMLKSGTFGAERRTVQQIVFPSEKEAEDALARLKAGKVTFDALAEEQKVAPEALTIGKQMTKAEIVDPKVADAAFTLQQDQVSDIVPSSFGPALVRVTEIQMPQFDQVKDKIKERLARERSQGPMNAARDSIEDMTANARPFADIAKELKLPLIKVQAVDKSGLDMNGQKVAGLPEAEQLVRAVFASNIDVDNAALNLRNGGGVWYRVTNVTPSRDRTLDEVRNQVADIWKKAEINDRLTKLANDQLAQIKNAADLTKAAAEAKATVGTATQLTRIGVPPSGIPANGVDTIFSTPVGKPSSLSGSNGRTIFIVTSATVPAPGTAPAETTALAGQMAEGLGQDFVLEYIAREQKDQSVTVDQNVIRAAIGNNQSEY